MQGDLYTGAYGETLTGPTLTAPYVTTFRNGGQFSGGPWQQDDDLFTP